MQLAHPLVAAGVAEHSSFRAAPRVAVARLHHTIRAMLALTFGDEREHAATIAGIREIHRHVNGRLPVATGIFPAGTPYSAEDPALVLWVHATLLESIPLIYERLVAPLTASERDAYCAEAAAVALELGAIPEAVPRTWNATLEYLDVMYSSGAIAVGNQAREVAHAVLSPRLRIASPLAAVNRLVTAGLMPEWLRRQYELPWTTRSEATFSRTIVVLSAVRKALPQPLAQWRPPPRHTSPERRDP
jgi:uncharacterized protein (DUF2236 family)